MAKKKSKNFFKENVKSGWNYIRESRKFIYIVALLFLIFVVVGFVFPAPESIRKVILEFIEQLLEKTGGMSWTELTAFIFFNNLKSSFFGMIFGIIFGIFSVVTAIVNGYILGFVAAKVVEAEGIATLWRLFPHGIFELPAVLISMGLGLRIGSFIFQKKKKEFLKKSLIQSLKTFIFVIIPLLIIAAVIESTLIFFVG